MYHELKEIEGMTNKEIMYIVAEEWIDEVLISAVSRADDIMQNEIIKSIICQAAECKCEYEKYRKEIATGKRVKDDFWYNSAKRDFQSYKTVVFDNIFREFGSNSPNV